MTSEATLNQLAADRLESRQIDELIGLARGLIADGMLNQLEIEFLHKWLVANSSISNQPLIRVLYSRISTILADGQADEIEIIELLDTLRSFTDNNLEVGETLKPTTLPLCAPAPVLEFQNITYCFTGTFNFGQRKHCEREMLLRGAFVGGLTRKTNVLVIGAYATESWKHSAFGNKIMQACEWRDQGHPISIVSEHHWTTHL